MAAADGRKNPALIDRLRAEPQAFDPLQALLVLERYAAEVGAARAGGDTPVGGDGPPRDEVVSFATETSLAFPVSELSGLVERPGAAPLIEVAFIGLHGPSGVLPPAYSELVLTRDRDKDTALASWLDIFAHRSTSFFLRASRKYRLAAQDDGAREGVANRVPSDLGIGGFLDAVLGLATGGLKGRLSPPHAALRFYGGAFAGQPRSAAVLEAVLSDYFGEKISVETFVPRWHRLDESEQTRMTSTGFCRLGEEAVIGSRVMRPEAAFRIRLGPLTYPRFRSFMPDRENLRQLIHLARLFAGEALYFDVQVVLAKDAVPPLQLDGENARLGWNTWSMASAPVADVDDALLSCDTVPG